MYISIRTSNKILDLDLSPQLPLRHLHDTLRQLGFHSVLLTRNGKVLKENRSSRLGQVLKSSDVLGLVHVPQKVQNIRTVLTKEQIGKISQQITQSYERQQFVRNVLRDKVFEQTPQLDDDLFELGAPMDM